MARITRGPPQARGVAGRGRLGKGRPHGGAAPISRAARGFGALLPFRDGGDGHGHLVVSARPIGQAVIARTGAAAISGLEKRAGGQGARGAAHRPTTIRGPPGVGTSAG